MPAKRDCWRSVRIGRRSEAEPRGSAVPGRAWDRGEPGAERAGVPLPRRVADGAGQLRRCASAPAVACAYRAVAGGGAPVSGRPGKDKNNKGFLVLLVIVPWIGALSFFLRRRCYPNTSVWRAGSISPLDPIPAPMGHKLYFTFLGALHRVMGMLLAYVILSRTWYAKRVGVPATTLVYDLLDPWSVAPLYESPINAPKVRAHGSPPRQVPWRVFPGVGALLSFIPLAWCGTLETNTRRNWTPGT
jgi:hypothetical protein